MECVREEILDTIDSFDDINSCVLECALTVYDAMSSEFDKIISIMESNGETIDSGFGLFQESELLDYATGKNTADSTIMKIIKFVPKLIIGIIKSIGSIFTKDNKKDLDTSIKNAQYTITNADEAQLTQLAKQSNEASNGSINFDPKTKKFTLGEKFKHTKNRLIMLGLFPAVMTKIRRACTSNNVPYKSLANDIKDIFLKNKAPDTETVSYTIESLKELMDDSFTVSLALKASCEEVSSLLEKQMSKDLANGKDIEKSKAAKDLIDQIGKISGVVTGVTGFTAISRKVLKIFGRPIVNSIRYTKERDEIADTKAEVKKNKALAKEYKKTAEYEQNLQYRKQKQTTKRDNTAADIEKNKKYLDAVRERNKIAEKIYEATGHYPNQAFSNKTDELVYTKKVRKNPELKRLVERYDELFWDTN